MKKIILLNLVFWTLILGGCLNNSTPADTTNNSEVTPVIDQTSDLPETNNQDVKAQTWDVEIQSWDVDVAPEEQELQAPTQNIPTQANDEQAAPIADDEMTAFTMEDIATHWIKESCWLVVNWYVYDVTDYINKHPWGEAIVEWCGKEATELFNTRPMWSWTPHSQNAKDMLKNYLIWKVKK